MTENEIIEENCSCQSMSCRTDCRKPHTHKTFFCDKCNPEGCKDREEQSKEKINKKYITANEIIEEAVKDIPEYGQLHCEDCCVNQEDDALRCDVGVGEMDCCENMRIIDSIIRTKIHQSMKTAVEEVTPEKLVKREKILPMAEAIHEAIIIGYGIAISDMEEKKRKFFGE